MGKTTGEIENHIEHTRDQLGSNIQELEDKVKTVTDWNRHFQNNPMTMLGAAFGGGVFLAVMLRNGKHGRSDARYAENRMPHAGTNRQKRQALETWDSIKGALIGVAASRFKDFVGEMVPGFHEQFQRTEETKKNMPNSAGQETSFH